MYRRDMLEAELLAEVRRMCRDLGLWTYHTRNSIGSDRGWPDLVIIGPHGIVFIELKRQHERPTPEQREVGRRLAGAGCRWDVWRPSDLIDGTIGRELAELS